MVSAQAPPLASEPWQSNRWSFSLRPPAAWSVVSLESPVDPPASRLAGLRVQLEGRSLGSRETGLVVAFTEPRAEGSGREFVPTITVAVRPGPGDSGHMEDARAATAFASATLAALEQTLTRVTPIQPFVAGRFAGAIAVFEYTQQSAQAQQQLAVSTIALLSSSRDRYFLLMVTAPSTRAGRYRRLLERVAGSLNDSLGAQRT